MHNSIAVGTGLPKCHGSFRIPFHVRGLAGVVTFSLRDEATQSWPAVPHKDCGDHITGTFLCVPVKAHENKSLAGKKVRSPGL